MLLRNGFDYKIEQKYVDPAGKYVGVQAQISDENYYIQRLLLAVLKKDDIAYENGIIIKGETRCLMNPIFNKPGGIITTRKNRWIGGILMTFNLHDIWRV